MNFGTLVIDQLEWYWDNLFRAKLDGLTDEEYLWEPAQPAWNVHPGPSGVTIDFAFPEPEPAPVTTIAWRLGHVTVGIFGMRASSHFGDGSLSYETAVWPATASAALEALDEQYAAWVGGLRSLDEAGWAAPCGPAEGPFGDSSMARLGLHINREAFHHGAEMLLLRDLWRSRPLSDG